MEKTIKKITILSLMILLGFLTVTICSADIVEEAILNQPIVEGRSLAGVTIGDHESDVYKLLGFPDKIHSDLSSSPRDAGKGLKLLVYSLGKGGGLLIRTRHQRVEVLHLLGVFRKTPDNYQGKTTKGIGLGDTVDSVRREYGTPDDKNFYWYKKYGIFFGADEKGVIGIIGVTTPYSEIPTF